MEHTVSERSWWRRLACRGGAEWYLLWMPLFLVAIDDRPDLASAMVRLGALVAMGALMWAGGAGAARGRAEALFVGAGLVGWMAAVGGVLVERGLPTGAVGWLAVAVALASGPLFLVWAWNRRRRRPRLEIATLTPISLLHQQGRRLLAVWLVTFLVLLAVAGLEAVHWADFVVLVVTVGLVVVFSVRGRAERLPEEE